MKISFSFLLYFNFFAFSLLARLDFENLKKRGEEGGKRREQSKIRAEQNQRGNQSEKGGLVEVGIPFFIFSFFTFWLAWILESKKSSERSGKIGASCEK